MHENRETSETPEAQFGSRSAGERLRPHGPRVRHRGVTLRHSTDEPFEQRRNARRRRVRREGCGSRRTLFHLTRTRLSAGLRVSHGWGSGRRSVMLGRYSSAIRTGCANERPSGSVRGAPGNWCPYRDRQLHGKALKGNPQTSIWAVHSRRNERVTLIGAESDYPLVV